MKPRWSRVLLWIALVAGGAGALWACGQKGDLYLPSPGHPKHSDAGR